MVSVDVKDFPRLNLAKVNELLELQTSFILFLNDSIKPTVASQSLILCIDNSRLTLIAVFYDSYLVLKVLSVILIEPRKHNKLLKKNVK